MPGRNVLPLPGIHRDETVWDATHTTYGIAQQDASYPNRSNGAAAQIAAFFDRLDKKREVSPGHGDIWLNLFWLPTKTYPARLPRWPTNSDARHT